MAKIDGTGMVYRNDVPAKWISDDNTMVSTTRSVYEMWVADRLVFLASTINADPFLQIQLGKPDVENSGTWYLSDGQARKSMHIAPSTDGSEVPDGFDEHIDGISMQEYVYPRILLILVKMYDLGINHR